MGNSATSGSEVIKPLLDDKEVQFATQMLVYRFEKADEMYSMFQSLPQR